MRGWRRGATRTGALLGLAVVLAGCGILAQKSPTPAPPAASVAAVRSASGTILLSDTFTRTVTDGWGAPETGPAWLVAQGQAAGVSVDGSAGLIVLSSVPGGHFPDVPIGDADLAVTGRFQLDRLPVGAPVSVHVWLRGTGGADTYRCYVSIHPDGSATVAMPAMVGNQAQGQTPNATVPETYAAGTWWRFHVVVSGTAPTTLQARVWPDGTDEPTTWLVDATDATPELQALVGRVSVGAYAGEGETAVPITVAVDDLVIAVP